MLEVIIDEFDDFIDSRYYKEDGKSTSYIINLEKYIVALLQGRQEITIKLLRS